MYTLRTWRNNSDETNQRNGEEAYKCGWDAGDFSSDCWEENYYKRTYGGDK
jgi:hypothetical protein